MAVTSYWKHGGLLSILLIVAITQFGLISSLQCYSCNSYDDPWCNTTGKEHHIVDCANEALVRNSYNDTTDLKPVCVTLEYMVLQVLTHTDHREVVFKKEMKKPMYRRYCALRKKSENRCITRNSNPMTKYVECTCEENLCNTHTKESSNFWLYFLSILGTLAVVGFVTFVVYKKIGCNFDK